MSYAPWPPAAMAGTTPRQGTMVGLTALAGIIQAIATVKPAPDGDYASPSLVSIQEGIVTGITAGSGGGSHCAVCGLGGAIVQGSISAAVVNLLGSSVTFTCAVVTCQPVAPVGDLGVTINIGTGTTLTILAGGTSSGIATGLSLVWPDGDPFTILVSSLTGEFDGSIIVTVGE